MVARRASLAATLAGLELMLRAAAYRYPEYAARLRERDLVVRITLRDGTLGRSFVLKRGVVRSTPGVPVRPDLTMVFQSAAVAARLLRPKRDYLAFSNAAKNFQLTVEGDDDLAVWFSQTLQMLDHLGVDYGVDLGGGTKRYTSNTNGGPVFVYVKNGKILRITPLDFDDEDALPWTVEARGRRFTPPRKTTISPHGQAWKSMVYSPDRLLYPLKRVDFDPGGDRHPENRGSSDYERITWDEALDIVAGEIGRVKRQHGPGALLSGCSAHHTWGNVGDPLSARARFFNTVGHTPVVLNWDSWEGWYWGAVHHWGHSGRIGAPETFGTVEDCLKNCELVVFWSSNPEGTGGVYGAHEGTVRRLWLRSLGVPFVHIDPFFNDTAALLGGKWLAPRPGTDSAMVLAVAHVWITEGLLDEVYVERNTVGFADWRSYILGVDDGQPKTPEWQEAETGVPAREVRALARLWGTRRTYLAPGGVAGFGGACRTATGSDWARGMVCLMAMQGLGKPGVNMGCMQQGTPVDSRTYFPGYSEGGFSGDLAETALSIQLYQRMPQLPTVNTVRQAIPKLKLPEAILDGKCSAQSNQPMSIEDQFEEIVYPAPGYAPAKMYYKYGGSHFGTVVDSNRFARMYRSVELEFVVNQSIWLEGEAKFADVILPACTSFERWDISEFANSAGVFEQGFTQCNHRVVVLQHKCIDPLGESRSDYQIFLDLAQRLGLGTIYSEGMTELDWCRRLFEASDLPELVSWREFARKGYFVMPAPAKECRDPVAYRWFAENRAKDTPDLTPLPGDYEEEYGKGLQTQSGKLEFVSSSLTRFDPDDPERPPMLKYVPSWEGPHAEDRFRVYPLQLVSPHPRFSFHTQGDGKGSFINDVSDHRVLVGDRYYWVARINPEDAVARGIQDGDVVEIFNDRGAVACVIRLTERVRPGLVHSYYGSAVYAPDGEPGRSGSTDLGGCVNVLTPSRMMLRRAHSLAANSCLVEVRPWRQEPAL